MTTDSPDIEDLISRVVTQDKSAFHELYERTSAKLFGVCLRILHDRQEAEDVLQEVYVKIWDKADKFASGKASAIAWLAAIARNQAIDRIRARKPESDDIDEMYDLADDGPTPESMAIQGDHAEQIYECLNELKPEHASAVKQTYLSGWTYQEAADSLNIPINTIKTWIRRSLISLRECMSR